MNITARTTARIAAVPAAYAVLVGALHLIGAIPR